MPAELDGQGDATEPGPQRLLLTVPQAAQLLGIGVTLVYEEIGRGKLPHIRIGRALRVPRQALESWIAANTVGTARSLSRGVQGIPLGGVRKTGGVS